MKKEIIAIDGPAGSGKSTIAKLVAKKLHYKYIDSGAMYRCVALYLIQNDIKPKNVAKVLDEIHIDFDKKGRVYLNGDDVSDEIRSEEVTKMALVIAQNKKVRAKLVEMQRAYGKDKGVVMDGRDIGTVVFKDAKVKIYQVASVEARAKRRYLEDTSLSYEQILADIKKRDYEDMHRSISPLIKADDAVEVDTSDLTIDETVDAILKIFKERVK
jgi:CMP/dCMP kinase